MCLSISDDGCPPEYIYMDIANLCLRLLPGPMSYDRSLQACAADGAQLIDKTTAYASNL